MKESIWVVFLNRTGENIYFANVEKELALAALDQAKKLGKRGWICEMDEQLLLHYYEIIEDQPDLLDPYRKEFEMYLQE